MPYQRTNAGHGLHCMQRNIHASGAVSPCHSIALGVQIVDRPVPLVTDPVRTRYAVVHDIIVHAYKASVFVISQAPGRAWTTIVFATAYDHPGPARAKQRNAACPHHLQCCRACELTEDVAGQEDAVLKVSSTCAFLLDEWVPFWLSVEWVLVRHLVTWS